MKVKRHAPGYYSVSDGDLSVTISHIEQPDQGDGYGRTDHWICAAEWDGHVADPVSHLWMAKEDAAEMIRMRKDETK